MSVIILLKKMWMDDIKSFRTFLRLLLFSNSLHSSQRDKTNHYFTTCSSGVTNLTSRCHGCNGLSAKCKFIKTANKITVPKDRSLSRFIPYVQEMQVDVHQPKEKKINLSLCCCLCVIEMEHLLLRHFSRNEHNINNLTICIYSEVRKIKWKDCMTWEVCPDNLWNQI